MAAVNDAQMPIRLTPIAPAPACPNNPGANGASPRPTMPYTCQTCAKRKVKCDKIIPVCSACSRSRRECLYQAPRPRKRKLSGDVDEWLVRNEHLQNQQKLLSQTTERPPPTEKTTQEPISLRLNEPGPSKTGRLLAHQDQGKSRYIDSSLWRSLGDDEMQHMSSDEEEDNRIDDGLAESCAPDPLTDAFIGSQQSLLDYHPTHTNALLLWEAHARNVEPLCKLLHLPSTFKMAEMASKQPAMVSKVDECLLFAIYHFAVFSMSEVECLTKFGESRVLLMRRYHTATRHALVNASFLKTTNMTVLQALVLFLLSCRHSYDPNTYWILTGVAVRIAQRVGLHRDGEKLGLPPFDVQMRRRLFYQLLPLDGMAGQMSGTGMGVIPDTWDTQQPLNIDDDQIWPGMTEIPKEQKGATEMIFCLGRACIGKFFASGKISMHRAGSWQFSDFEAAEQAIDEAESEVEEKFIRYCDVANPLHFLTAAMARCGITAMRMRIRLPKVKNQTATDTERRELFQLAQKILDTDTAAYAHAGLKRFMWHLGPFFLWGTWDSLIFALTSLCRTDLLSSAETSSAWSRMEQVYDNHDELFGSKRALYIAFGRLTLKAWGSNPPGSSLTEPAFITSLRAAAQRRVEGNSSTRKKVSVGTALDTGTGTASPAGLSLGDDSDLFLSSLSSDMDFDMGGSFDLDSADWSFWEQLIQNDRVQGG